MASNDYQQKWTVETVIAYTFSHCYIETSTKPVISVPSRSARNLPGNKPSRRSLPAVGEDCQDSGWSRTSEVSIPRTEKSPLGPGSRPSSCEARQRKEWSSRISRTYHHCRRVGQGQTCPAQARLQGRDECARCCWRPKRIAKMRKMWDEVQCPRNPIHRDHFCLLLMWYFDFHYCQQRIAIWITAVIISYDSSLTIIRYYSAKACLRRFMSYRVHPTWQSVSHSVILNMPNSWVREG